MAVNWYAVLNNIACRNVLISVNYGVLKLLLQACLPDFFLTSHNKLQWYVDVFLLFDLF